MQRVLLAKRRCAHSHACRFARAFSTDKRPISHGGNHAGTASPDDPQYNGEFRAEALQLYRDCLRLARGFTLVDPSDGVMWRTKLERSTREEFDNARHEENKFEVCSMVYVVHHGHYC